MNSRETFFWTVFSCGYLFHIFGILKFPTFYWITEFGLEEQRAAKFVKLLTEQRSILERNHEII